MAKPKNPNRILFANTHVPSVLGAPAKLRGRGKTCLGLSRDINKHLPEGHRPHTPRSVMSAVLSWFNVTPEYIVETHPKARTLDSLQRVGLFLGMTTPTGTIRRNPEWKA